MNIFLKLTSWYFTKKALPYWSVLILDCCVVLFSTLIGSYIEMGGYELINNFWQVLLGAVLCLPLFILCFHLFHTYLGIIRFSSYVDLYRIGKATLIACCLSGLIGTFVHSEFCIFPSFKSAFIIFCLSTLLIWIVRITVKASFEGYNIDKAQPVAIYGTQAGGIALANSICSVKEKQYILRCFISDREKRAGIYLLGKKVYLNNDHIVDILIRKGVKILLVSPLKSDNIRSNPKMVDALTRAHIKIMMMPAAEEWDGKSKLSYNQLHEVEIEDLLPREKIEVDMECIKQMLAGHRILITGAAGSIGSEMARQVAMLNPSELVLVDQAETPMHDVRLYMKRNHSDLKVWTIVGSITNKSQMDTIFAVHKPEYVFHAAAYKHVPMMEDNPAMAVQNNVFGTRVIADLAVKYGTKKFVMISTDKAVNPTNVMGCSKRICEIYCQSLNQAIQDGVVIGVTQFVTTRFGNVLGSNGSVIPLFKKQIRSGGPVTVTHKDIIRYFMLIPEACRLVLEAGTMGKGGEIFVFDMGEPVRIADLAQRMIHLSGAKNIEIKYTGLRDGEKLYEEVLNDAEQTKPTVHPKIKVAAVREYSYELALQNEKDLYELSLHYDDMAIVKKMKEIVPEYKSKVSKYEVLDKR